MLVQKTGKKRENVSLNIRRYIHIYRGFIYVSLFLSC